MAIDSTLFVASIPAGTYAAGDTVALSVVRGPNVVRDGYGTAKMKQIICLEDATGQPIGYVTLKNSNWIDEIGNFAVQSSTGTNFVLSSNSAAIQRCGNVELQPNSSWTAVYHITEAITTTVDYDVFLLVDVDYPNVTAVENPRTQDGAPVSMFNDYTVTTTAFGTADSSINWNTVSVDIFKAGYRYLLAEVGGRAMSASGAQVGFFSISGAAGQAGLERIVPFCPGGIPALRYGLEYSTPIQKGPMNLSIAIISSSSVSDTVLMEMDFIRRG